MKYILQRQFEHELSARREYLLSTYHKFFVVYSVTPTYIEMESFPFDDNSVLLLYGHCNWIIKYCLANHSSISQKTKIIHSCFPSFVANAIHQEKVYFSKVNALGYTECFNGIPFGFNFKISNSELDAYNSAHLPFWEQIRFAYKKVG